MAKKSSLRRQITEVEDTGEDTVAGQTARNAAEDILAAREALEQERQQLEKEKQEFAEQRRLSAERSLRNIEKADKEAQRGAARKMGKYAVDTGDIVVTFRGQHWGPGVVDCPDQETGEAIARAVLKTRRERQEEELIRRTPPPVEVDEMGQVRVGRYPSRNDSADDEDEEEVEETEE